eukprot:COSAG05_NODE_5395_length_1189_cov_0.984404_1_plen_184_part_10
MELVLDPGASSDGGRSSRYRTPRGTAASPRGAAASGASPRPVSARGGVVPDTGAALAQPRMTNGSPRRSTPSVMPSPLANPGRYRVAPATATQKKNPAAMKSTLRGLSGWGSLLETEPDSNPVDWDMQKTLHMLKSRPNIISDQAEQLKKLNAGETPMKQLRAELCKAQREFCQARDWRRLPGM